MALNTFERSAPLNKMLSANSDSKRIFSNQHTQKSFSMMGRHFSEWQPVQCTGVVRQVIILKNQVSHSKAKRSL